MTAVNMQTKSNFEVWVVSVLIWVDEMLSLIKVPW